MYVPLPETKTNITSHSIQILQTPGTKTNTINIRPTPNIKGKINIQISQTPWTKTNITHQPTPNGK